MSTSDIRWNQQPLLQVPSEQLSAHFAERAFVVLLFTPPTPDSSLQDYLINQMQWTQRSTRIIESEHSIKSIQQDGLHLTFLFEEPQAAMSAALTLLALHQHDFHIGAGMGSGYTFDHFKSLDLFRLKGALPFGNTVELQVSSALKLATTLPNGIGAFQCSPKLAQRTGMNYWVLKDYRSSLE